MKLKKTIKIGLLCMCTLVAVCIALSGCKNNSQDDLLQYLGMQNDLAENQLKENGYLVSKNDMGYSMTRLSICDYNLLNLANMTSFDDNIDLITIEDNIQSVNLLGIHIGMTAEKAINILTENGFNFEQISTIDDEDNGNMQVVIYQDNDVSRIAFEVCTTEEIKDADSFDESEIEKKEKIVALVASYIPDTNISNQNNDSRLSESESVQEEQVSIEDHEFAEEEKIIQNLFLGKWNYSNAQSIAEEVYLEFLDSDIVKIYKARETYSGTYEIIEPHVAALEITENTIYDNSTASERQSECNISGTATIHDNLLDYSITYENGWIDEVSNLVKEENVNSISENYEDNQDGEEFEPGYLASIKSLSDFGLQLYNRDLWDWEPKEFVDTCNNRYHNLLGYFGTYSSDSNNASVHFPAHSTKPNGEITDAASLNINIYGQNMMNTIEIDGDSINEIYVDKSEKLEIGHSGEEFIENILPDITYMFGDEEIKLNLLVQQENGQEEIIGVIYYFPDWEDKWRSASYAFALSATYRGKSLGINIAVNKETDLINYIKIQWK